MFKIGDKVKANEVYGDDLPIGAEGVVVGFWKSKQFVEEDRPIVDFSKFMNDESFHSYYMKNGELEAM